MPIEYRTARGNDEERALDLWSSALEVDRDALRRESRSDPRFRERTFVAATPDGSVVSALQYWVRDIRDAEGAPRRAGYVYTLATRPDARGLGHAGRLLERASTAMQHEGCAWALLLTTEARGFYERHGWRAFPRAVWQGTLRDDLAFAPTPYIVRDFDPEREPGGWDAIAAVYAAANARRPLTVVRDSAYWRNYAAQRFRDLLARDNVALFVAQDSPADTRPRGYALAVFLDAAAMRERFGVDVGSFGVTEVGVLPGHWAALDALLGTIGARAAAGGMPLSRLPLPVEPAIETPLRHLFGSTLHTVRDEQPMGRVLDPAFGERRLEAMFAAPGAMFWSIDGD